ncbi:MAG: hypothetical protein NTV34_12960, partial [Proteobacteria bacterium]|nr:hypothetical protein [Pseudomonadota bacterium]
TDDDKRELQEASLSNADKLELLFRQQSKTSDTQFSKEQFLGRLLADFTASVTKAAEPHNEGKKGELG